MTVLVVDHGHSTRCGIRDLGVRIAERLGAAHADCNSYEDYMSWRMVHLPDVIIVNYRADLMPWWRPSTNTPTFAVLHQYGPATVDQRAAELLARGFDHVLVLDPTVHPADPRVHAVGRPLPPEPSSGVGPRPDVPRIGSFGFAFPHKGFADVAAEVATIPDAVYALHMPEAHFNGAQGMPVFTDGILADVRSRLNGHALEFSDDELTPQELVDWLAGNTVNCLLYAPGQPEAGLSSALDYLIAAGRPILVSDAEMFGADDERAATWPDVRLEYVMEELDFWQSQVDILRTKTAGQFESRMAEVLASL